MIIRGICGIIKVLKRNRRIGLVASGVVGETSLIIREYTAGFEKIYNEDKVQIRFKE